MKTCTACGICKPLEAFSRHAGRADGLSSVCKGCKSVADKKYAKENSEKVKKKQSVWYLRNRERLIEKFSAYHKTNSEKMRPLKAAYREANKDKQAAWHRSWLERNREYFKGYLKDRFANCPKHAVSVMARNRVNAALKRGGMKKTSRTAEILGCDFDALVKHLGSQFRPGMSWVNRGQWHIDHIVPLASAKTEDGLLALCHYTNLQPLWAVENLAKGARMPRQMGEPCAA